MANIINTVRGWIAGYKTYVVVIAMLIVAYHTHDSKMALEALGLAFAKAGIQRGIDEIKAMADSGSTVEKTDTGK